MNERTSLTQVGTSLVRTLSNFVDETKVQYVSQTSPTGLSVS